MVDKFFIIIKMQYIKLKIGLVFIIGLMIGLFVGYSYGVMSSLDWCVKTGMYFLKLKGIQIDVDTNSIVQGLQQYKNQVIGCYR